MQEQIHLAESFIANAEAWKQKGRIDLATKSLEGAAEIYEELAGIASNPEIHDRYRAALLTLEHHHLAHGNAQRATEVKKQALRRVARKQEAPVARTAISSAGRKHSPDELDCTCPLGEEDTGCPEHSRIRTLKHAP